MEDLYILSNRYHKVKFCNHPSRSLYKEQHSVLQQSRPLPRSPEIKRRTAGSQNPRIRMERRRSLPLPLVTTIGAVPLSLVV
eukprot:3124091-Amphidinium_carterae.1